ncbi:methylmalonyl-CoA mutase family protein [Actinoplanes sp. NPDC023801]|uniref:methylmalonyl-CoA mutase family protein n=1 Tax=Actinoplanes sp. NPDC023801 TaxID=3154595 RepID=UPI0033C74FD4
MPTPTSDLTGEWRRLALAVLRKSGRAGAGDDPAVVDRLLATVTEDDIVIPPLFTPDTVVEPAGEPGAAPFTRGGRPPGDRTGWDIRQRHDLGDPASPAAAARDVDGGVTSLWLPGTDPQRLAELLENTGPARTGVVLQGGAAGPALAAVWLDTAARRGVADTALHGNLGADPLGDRARGTAAPPWAAVADLARRCAGSLPGVRAVVADAMPYHWAGATDAQELGYSLATAVAYLRALTDAGMPAAEAASQIEFRYAATTDEFLTIAKLRSARRLWTRVQEACGITPSAQRQHAVTSGRTTTTRHPWANLPRATLACFGAVVGGADAITVRPFDTGSETGARAARLARNTHLLLREEAHLARVADPAGGAWSVEWLTTALAHRAWEWFTGVEAAGGMSEALTSGRLERDLATSWDRRAEDVRRGRRPVVGVSRYAAVGDEASGTDPELSGRAGLPCRRDGQQFEELRDRTDAFTRITGRRPAVLLVALGGAASASRAMFATDLFAAAGVTVERVDDPDRAGARLRETGLTVACLAGDPDSYELHAEKTAALLAEAGARAVHAVGGCPPCAGVSAFTDGDDAVEVLRSLLTDLEIA